MSEPIAIVSMACVFPGANSPQEFWQALLEGKDLTQKAGLREIGLDPDLFLADKKGVADHYYNLRGGFVTDFKFDGAGYKVHQKRLEGLDEVCQWPMFVARHALEQAGYFGDKAVLDRCGLILGNLSFPTKSSNRLCIPLYHKMQERALKTLLENPSVNLELPGPTAIENRRIAGHPALITTEALGLGGVSYTLDAACSTSLYSLALAAEYLNTGKADMMLAGAVSAADPFFVNMGFSTFQAYPLGSDSRPLDKGSKGLVSGEGAGVFLLKRLSDAQRDGDEILATLVGYGLSNDGTGKSVLSPNPKGQQLAFERAYESTDVNPKDVDYVECHATGTPLGDVTELGSLETFFQPKQANFKVGSVKSNCGHLLTAAGMASMMKVVLSMGAGQIPATLHLHDPLSSPGGWLDGSKMVGNLTPWPENTEGRRLAGVNAFGFGGTNAHVILERNTHPKTKAKKPAKVEMKPLSIIGMEAYFGTAQGLGEFQTKIAEGKPDLWPLPENRWSGLERSLPGERPMGSWVKPFGFDYLRHKIPPNPADPVIAQQLLMLKVAGKAIEDAKLPKGGNVGVLIAMETDLELHRFRGRIELDFRLAQAFERAGIPLSAEQKEQLTTLCKDSLHNKVGVNQFTSFIGNIMASRIASLWDFNGPAFTLSAESSASYKGFELAQMWLSTGQVDAVVLGAVDMLGSAEEGLLQLKANPRLFHGGAGFYWSKGVNGLFVGEGAGALVLTTAEFAQKQHKQSYAVIESIERFGPDSRSGALKRVYKKFGPPTLLEVSAKAEPKLAQIEAKGLNRELDANSVALGSVSAVFGRLESSLGVAAVIKAALALKLKQLPGVDGWDGPKPELGLTTPLWVPTEFQPWLHFADTPRRAAVNHLAPGGEDYHLLLAESMEPGPSKPLEREHILPKPLLLIGDSLPGILAQLKALDFSVALETLCQQSLKNPSKGTHRLVLLGTNLVELEKERQVALDSLGGPRKTPDWQSPGGSYYTSQNLGTGKLAFVYPGGFTSHLGMGRGLLRLFPELSDIPATYAKDPDQLFRGDQIYPKSLEPQDQQSLKMKQRILVGDAIGMFETGINASMLQTLAVKNMVGVKPDVAFGYSMGEVTMAFALGLWETTDSLSQTLRKKPVFQTKLAGPMETVHKAWGLKKSESVLWATYAVQSSPELVKQAVQGEDRVYLMIINSPGESVLGGDKVALERLIVNQGWAAKQLPVSDAIHADFVSDQYKPLYNLHHCPVTEHLPNIDFYSAINHQKTDVTSDQLAENIATIYTQTVDFPELVNSTYQDGVRVFVELSPQPSCSRWINETLSDKPHLAISFEQKGVAGELSWAKGLAKLAAHGVPVDWSVFFSDQEPENTSREKIIEPGSEPIESKIIEQGRLLLGRRPSPSQNIFPEVPKDEVVLPVKPMVKSKQVTAPKVEKPPVRQVAMIPSPKPLAPAMPVVFKPAKPLFEPGSLLAAQARTHQLHQTQSQLSKNHLAFLLSRRAGFRLEASGFFSGVDSPQEAVLPVSVPKTAAPSVPDSYTERIVNHVPTLEALLKQHPTVFVDSGRRKEKEPSIIWDETDLMEFAEGRIEPVFGADYAPIDTYGPRVRLPLPPYMLANRVTGLEATAKAQKPSKMITEYDIPIGAWYAVDGQIPWAIAVEAGQCDLLLISYLGLDFQAKGEYLYRLLDCTLTFKGEMPKEGQTMRYEIYIDSFAKHGNNTLFFFHYDCFVGDDLVHTMTGGCAGFFSQEDLAHGRGVILTEKEKADHAKVVKRRFDPLIQCQKSQFSRPDLIQLCRGEVSSCFGPQFNQGQRNQGLRFSTEEFLMLDQITSVNSRGGVWGLGEVKAQRQLAPDHWYFTCHFKDDSCLAGSLMAEGCVQLLEFYLLFMGMQDKTENARFVPIKNLDNKVRCRGQVLPSEGLLEYRMQVTDIGLEPRPYAKANVDIIMDGRVIVDFIDVGIELVEKDAEAAKLPLVGAAVVSQPARELAFDDQAVWEFALGSLAKCFGPAYQVFEGRPSQRNPNKELQLISRVPVFEGTPGVFKDVSYLESEYDVPEDVWFLKHNPGGVTPYAVIMEIALQPCGFLGAAMQSPLMFPELQLCFRNLDAQATLEQNPKLAGETITCKAWLDSTSGTGGTIIQQYRFELWVQGERFYHGKTTFGYFTPKSLANQAGMDSGAKRALWHQQKGLGLQPMVLAENPQFFQGTACCGNGPLDFLSQVAVVSGGGDLGLGYIYGIKQVDPTDWFYPCHFHEDPVMPGSLGVESILQGMKTFAMNQQLTSGFRQPVFDHSLGQTSWKYRGQIIPQNREMEIEVHITSINRESSKVLVEAKANLYKDGLRIYSVEGLTLSIEESGC